VALRHLESALVTANKRMKLSARNVISGTLVEVTKGHTTAHVRIDIGGQVLTASITTRPSMN